MKFRAIGTNKRGSHWEALLPTEKSTSDAPIPRLTSEQVLSIRERYAKGGITQQALADRYGKRLGTISAIIKCTSWKKLKLFDLEGRAHHRCGEASPKAVLTADDVLSIRAQFKKGSRQSDLSRDYSVSEATIFDIVHNRSWKHLL